MKRIKDEISAFKSVMSCIAKQFGDKCEVVLHDFSSGYENSIVAIENGHVTGRGIGSSITNLGLEYIQNDDNEIVEGVYNYQSQTKDGKVIKSSSSIIRDEKNKVIGTLCINYDISDFIIAENLIKQFTVVNERKDVNEVFVKDVNELLEHYLSDCIKEIGKPVVAMTKEDKVAAIKFLDDRGVFSITKSGNKVCDLFNISKFTLYNYLDEIRAKSK